ncbi:MAG: glycerol-3-phosphate 1-O-acyltransferase PlsY [Deltaproteobacteria bacterium]|nr:glycerol-3-phosphate 1-O-acyltransferase PlsY [Deltaproteobacteria bacterium]
MWTLFFLFVIGAYLLASIPFGLIIARKVKSVDISQAGSGNVGATNVAREVGIKWGVITLLADTLKGLIPVMLAQGYVGTSLGSQECLTGLIGLSALIGHQFPVYRRFRGGKGTATCLGVFLAIAPLSCLYSGMVFLSVVIFWRYISLGSMIAALSLPIWLYLLGHTGSLIVLSLLMAVSIVFLHRGNIRRLVQGSERKWKKKVKAIDPSNGPDRHQSKTL